jgi:hypothetical protein
MKEQLNASFSLFQGANYTVTFNNGFTIKKENSKKFEAE